MKATHLFYTGLLATAVLVSCQKEEKKQTAEATQHEEKKDYKKKKLDFSPLKAELKLDAEKEKQLDEITAKYQKLKEENYQAAKQGGKTNYVALGIKNEELVKLQAEEVAKILSPEQMVVFNKFIDENTRKRPRYNDELLAKIKTEINLSDDQMKIVNAANDAFEKSFYDAHDIYHGNYDLAEEYWNKFDAQRKSAIEKILTPEQVAKFQELVKDEKITSKFKRK